MKLSIVFPAWNEEENIERAVRAGLRAIAASALGDGEVVVVDDGSTDRTAEIVEGLAHETAGAVRLVRHAGNEGYAAALRDGFAAARGDWVFYSDADNQFDLREIPLLLDRAQGADMVIGWRRDRQDPPLRLLVSWGYNRLIRLLFGLSVRDIDCAFKLFRRDVFDRAPIRSSRFLVDTEILVKARRAGMTIREVGVTHLPRRGGASTVRPRDVLRTLGGVVWLWREVRRGA